MCDCIERLNKQLRLQNNVMRTAISYPDGLERIMVAMKLNNPRKKGKPMNFYATFCPFCGERYVEEDNGKE